MDRVKIMRDTFFLLIENASPEQQILLIRVYGFGESVRKIAIREGVSYQALYQRLNTALRHAGLNYRLLRCIGIHWLELRAYGRTHHSNRRCGV